MNRSLIILILLIITINSCTTVHIRERDAFDIKRTISTAYFNDQNLELTEVTFPTPDSLALDGWFIKNPNARGTILYFGGNGFVRVASYHIINTLLQQPMNLMVFDYRGYGQNPGTPTVEGLKLDGLAAYDYLLGEEKIAPNSIILHGHSLGSFIATFVATQRSAAGLILECPITDAKDWTKRLMPWFFKPLVKFDIDPVLLANSNLKRIQKLELPLLFVGGEKDNITPASMTEKLFETARSNHKQIKIIEGGGHNDLPQRPAYQQELTAFLNKIFGGIQ